MNIFGRFIAGENSPDCVEATRRDFVRSTAGLGTALGLAGLGMRPAVAGSHAKAGGSAAQRDRLADGMKLDIAPLTFSSKREHFLNSLRMEGTAKHEDVSVWYANLLYMLFVPGKTPVPFLGREACESVRTFQMDDAVFQFHASSFSCPYDVETREYISSVTHPVTGETVPFPPFKVNVTDPGVVYTEDGGWPIPARAKSSAEAKSLAEEFGDGHVVGLDAVEQDRPGGREKIQAPAIETFRRENDLVFMDRIRVAPDSSWWPVEFCEHSCIQSSLADLKDSRLSSIPAVSTGSWLLPTSKRWVPGLEDTNGYFIVHLEGRKLRDIEQLPARFLNRAKSEFPAALSVPLDRFRPDVEYGS